MNNVFEGKISTTLSYTRFVKDSPLLQSLLLSVGCPFIHINAETNLFSYMHILANQIRSVDVKVTRNENFYTMNFDNDSKVQGIRLSLDSDSLKIQLLQYTSSNGLNMYIEALNRGDTTFLSHNFRYIKDVGNRDPSIIDPKLSNMYIERIFKDLGINIINMNAIGSLISDEVESKEKVVKGVVGYFSSRIRGKIGEPSAEVILAKDLSDKLGIEFTRIPYPFSKGGSLYITSSELLSQIKYSYGSLNSFLNKGIIEAFRVGRTWCITPRGVQMLLEIQTESVKSSKVKPGTRYA